MTKFNIDLADLAEIARELRAPVRFGFPKDQICRRAADALDRLLAEIEDQRAMERAHYGNVR